ncbi:helix-turn-helix domain-containing protein [Microbacterium sp. NPDC096154]|uniref:helix-turn-helix domain-containing protein n=1 Tax=Microbacterium sp. NPDC096154 TaxID=3155549 RepID=UPI00332A1390
MTADKTDEVNEDRATARGVPENLIPKYDEDDVSAIFRVSVRTVQGWRIKGGGPAYVKIGDQVRYRLGALLDYLDERTVGRG